ncbi:MAG: SRPBCC family protein [Halococcoides sp.]
MATSERSSIVDAPFEDVWAFHSTLEGLEALTPDWVGLRVESVRGPEGDAIDDLVAGTTATISVRPLGIGPRQRVDTHIVERERDDDSGYFIDEFAGGPFADWRHTHQFEAVEGGTQITDHVEYALRGGAVGRILSPLAIVGFVPAFRDRHRRTATHLE